MALSKTTNRLFKALVYFYFISLCGACLSPKDQAGAFLCLTDSYGRKIKLTKAPEKIISLSPGITEMLFLLNAENKIIGISNYCHFPEETNRIKKVGGLQNLNIETMISLHPDLVLIGSIIPKNEADKLEKSGITVIAVKEEEKLEGMLKALKTLGQVVDKNEAADSLVRYYGKKIVEYRNVEATGSSPTVYYVVGFGAGGDFTAPGNSHINEIINLAGGKNIGENLTTWSISREYLFSQNPELIFVRSEDLSQFVKTYPYTLLNAVNNNRTYPIESGWIDVISPRNFLAIEEIKEKIEVFTKF